MPVSTECAAALLSFRYPSITDSYPNDPTSTYDGVAELQTFKPLPGATSACLQCFLASRKCTLRLMGLSFVPAVCGCPGSL